MLKRFIELVDAWEAWVRAMERNAIASTNHISWVQRRAEIKDKERDEVATALIELRTRIGLLERDVQRARRPESGGTDGG